MINRTLVLIKPDGVRRGISGEIISRFEKVGLKIVAMKLIHVSPNFAKQHYTYDDIAVRHGEEVWKKLLAFISASPVIAMVLEGDEAWEIVRKMVGSTEPTGASPGTIRGDYAHHSYSLSSENNASIHNLVHASASKEEADREITAWFCKAEICAYRRNDDNEHIYK